MKIVDFNDCEAKDVFLTQIDSCDWSAGEFLAELIRENRLEQTLGGWAKLFLLVDNDTLVSFVTLSAQDCVDDINLFPWIGFFFTSHEYRGHRYGRLLIDYACDIARDNGYGKVYLATDNIGLYEKYGFDYLESRIDVYGEDSRIYVKEI